MPVVHGLKLTSPDRQSGVTCYVRGCVCGCVSCDVKWCVSASATVLFVNVVCTSLYKPLLVYFPTLVNLKTIVLSADTIGTNFYNFLEVELVGNKFNPQLVLQFVVYLFTLALTIIVSGRLTLVVTSPAPIHRECFTSCLKRFSIKTTASACV